MSLKALGHCTKGFKTLGRCTIRFKDLGHCTMRFKALGHCTMRFKAYIVLVLCLLKQLVIVCYYYLKMLAVQGW